MAGPETGQLGKFPVWNRGRAGKYWQGREPVLMLENLSHIFGMPVIPLLLCVVLTIFW